MSGKYNQNWIQSPPIAACFVCFFLSHLSSLAHVTPRPILSRPVLPLQHPSLLGLGEEEEKGRFMRYLASPPPIASLGHSPHVRQIRFTVWCGKGKSGEVFQYRTIIVSSPGVVWSKLCALN
ncbi:hypothetical protein E2C01_054159 [Portunus trituberculatus]|uniref:Uncharacterized protein n=1 Tax=Portunus trituberculatus TaxID=210409 RepID=A0A5B7GJ46_PORTR|nr:hypothetical protein [Portunus trituberculatus]